MEAEKAEKDAKEMAEKEKAGKEKAENEREKQANEAKEKAASLDPQFKQEAAEAEESYKKLMISAGGR